jgi:predicted metal-binding membrane protein
MDSAGTSQRTFYGAVALVVATSAAATLAWCAPMQTLDGMRMAGGSMDSTSWAWARGATSLAAAASFLGMWVSMTPAMMLPSLAPSLWRYREAVASSGATHPDRLTVVAALAYLCVWTMAGEGVLLVGAALTEFAAQVPLLAGAAPLASGLTVVAMGVVQRSGWKARQLARCGCHSASGGPLPPDARSAWRHGVRLGVDCVRCCANLMAILLATGPMDLRAMGLVTGMITLERLSPAGSRAARVTGGVAVGAGALLLTRALGLA